MKNLRIAVQGCCHGELDQVFEKVRELHSQDPIDLLIILGDFQSIRDDRDFESISIPPKYRKLGDFKGYYEDDSLRPPVKTIFIGGNHESMRHLMLLPHGGYVANDIYYMGYSNVLWYRGIRIGGLSGIWKKWDYNRRRPDWGYLDKSSSWSDKVRELYHVRESDMLPLFMLKNESSSRLDLMLSHDWPSGVVYHGDLQDILKKKPFFSRDIQTRQLGNPKSWELLRQLKPKWWLSAHLHVKYEATVKHSKRKLKKNEDELDLDLSGDEEEELDTKFLALDKCLPRRSWLEVIEVESNTSHKSWEHEDNFYWDPEFLANLQFLARKPHTSSNKLNESPEMNCSAEVEWEKYMIPTYTDGIQRMEELQTKQFLERLILNI